MQPRFSSYNQGNQLVPASYADVCTQFSVVCSGLFSRHDGFTRLCCGVVCLGNVLSSCWIYTLFQQEWYVQCFSFVLVVIQKSYLYADFRISVGFKGLILVKGNIVHRMHCSAVGVRSSIDIRLLILAQPF
jgi:hypothetical protein